MNNDRAQQNKPRKTKGSDSVQEYKVQKLTK